MKCFFKMIANNNFVLSHF